MNLASNNLQRFISQETQTTNQPWYPFEMPLKSDLVNQSIIYEVITAATRFIALKYVQRVTEEHIVPHKVNTFGYINI